MKLSAGRVGATVGIAVAAGALVIGGIAVAPHGSGPSTSPAVLVDDQQTPGPTASHPEGPDDRDHHGVGATATEGPDDSGHHDVTGVDHRRGANQPED